MKHQVPKTYEARIDDIRKTCHREEFRMTVFPDGGFQSVCVTGKTKEGYGTKSWTLMSFPIGIIAVVNEQS